MTFRLMDFTHLHRDLFDSILPGQVCFLMGPPKRWYISLKKFLYLFSSPFRKSPSYVLTSRVVINDRPLFYAVFHLHSMSGSPASEHEVLYIEAGHDSAREDLDNLDTKKLLKDDSWRVSRVMLQRIKIWWVRFQQDWTSLPYQLTKNTFRFGDGFQ